MENQEQFGHRYFTNRNAGDVRDSTLNWDEFSRPNYLYDTAIPRTYVRGDVFALVRELYIIVSIAFIVAISFTTSPATALINAYSLAHIGLIYMYVVYMFKLHTNDLLPYNAARTLAQVQFTATLDEPDINLNCELYWVKVTRILSIYIMISWYVIFVYYLHADIDLTKYVYLIDDTDAEIAPRKQLSTIYIFSTVLLPVQLMYIMIYIFNYTTSYMLYTVVSISVISANIAYIIIMWALCWADYGLSTPLLSAYTVAYAILISVPAFTNLSCGKYDLIGRPYNLTDIYHWLIISANSIGVVTFLLYMTSSSAS